MLNSIQWKITFIELSTRLLLLQFIVLKLKDLTYTTIIHYMEVFLTYTPFKTTKRIFLLNYLSKFYIFVIYNNPS